MAIRTVSASDYKNSEPVPCQPSRRRKLLAITMEWTWLLALAAAVFQICKGEETPPEQDLQDFAAVGPKDIDKRAPCSAKFYQFNPHHSACLRSRNHGPKDGISSSDRSMIIDTHNDYRGRQYATNMQKMYWDNELAMIAQKWADNCQYKHDDGSQRSIPKRMQVGQNIAMDTYSSKNWKKVMGMWYDEIKDFTYGGTNEFHKVGHYTQMVWDETPLIGCGFTKCPPNGRLKRPWNFYVCNYGPAGNLFERINKPYKAGQKGRDCQRTSRNGLCDCNGKVCMNQGTLDIQKCSCKCMDKPWITQPNCEVQCNKAEDTEFCHGAFGTNPCQYSNVPLEYCPKLCNLC